MDKKITSKIIWGFLILFIVAVGVYCFCKSKEHFIYDFPYEPGKHPGPSASNATAQEIEFIKSESGDIDAENLSALDMELIPPLDIAMSPGYGYGPGGIGFGRYGSSFMM